MKSIRLVLWGLVGLVAAWAAFLALDKVSPDASTKLGAPFSLQTADGKPITDKDFLGRPHLIFFGFTHCPEVCPTTLYETTGWMDALGDDADKLDAYFITIDPERDTPEILANYMSPFKDKVVGITGTAEEIDKAAKGFHVYYKKVPLEDGDYTMDHTASIFLMKPDGSFMGTIAWQENPDIALEKIKRLLKS